MNMNQIKQQIEVTWGGALNELIEKLPDITAAVFILVVGYIVALIVGKLFFTLFKKLRFDYAADRIQLTSKIRAIGLRKTPSELIAKLFFWLIMLFTVITAAGYLGLDSFVDNLTSLAMYIPKLAAALIILVAGLFVAHFVRNAVKENLKGVIPATAGLVSSFVYGLLTVVITLTILEQLSFDTGFIQTLILIVFGGFALAIAISIGIGSAPQLKKTLAGYYLKDHLQVGQEVTVGDKSGQVVKIKGSCTEIQTADGIMVVPNDDLLEQTYYKGR